MEENEKEQLCIGKVIYVSLEDRRGVIDRVPKTPQKRVETPHGDFILPEDTPTEAGEHILVKYYPQDQFAYPVKMELVAEALKMFTQRHSRDTYCDSFQSGPSS